MRNSFDSIAFCGGGGKGSYHIGVWKSLEEHGLLQNIRAVSGSSIGALNAVLFALGDFEHAKQLWYQVRESDVYAKNTGDSTGLFSRSGLERILRGLELSRLRESPCSVFINIYNLDNHATESKYINSLPEDDIISILLSSTALPLIFGRQKYNGQRYWDGGLFEEGEAPIAPLYNTGCRSIALLALKNDFALSLKSVPIIGPDLKAKYADADIEVFLPLDDLGWFPKGTANFSPSSIRDKMIAGYRDTNHILSSEDVYTVKNDYARINIHIRQKMTELLKSGDEIEDFIKITNFSNPNIVMPTSGGHLFYSDIVTLFGWRVQQHNLIGLHSHYRILDPENRRRAWVLNPDDIVRALADYEASMKFSQSLGNRSSTDTKPGIKE